MKPISRRSFVGHAAAGFAVLATPGITADAKPLFNPSDWHMASFEQLLTQPFEVKQAYDVTAIDEGNAFDHMVNSLNGLHFGFGIPAAEIKIVGALRSKATILNYGDSMWEKYHIGELAKINDPKTGKPATRNIYYASAAGDPPKYTSEDPNNDASAEQDASLQALQARGVQLLACHMAMQRYAGYIVKTLKLQQTQEEVVQDLQSHLLPGVLVVPAMVAAIAMLQTKGHFTYIRM